MFLPCHQDAGQDRKVGNKSFENVVAFGNDSNKIKLHSRRN